jgi:hypothetical protein
VIFVGDLEWWRKVPGAFYWRGAMTVKDGSYFLEAHYGWRKDDILNFYGGDE